MLSRVAGGSGSPALLTPSSPATWRCHSNGAASALSAASVPSTISGPMPSPAISVTGMSMERDYAIRAEVNGSDSALLQDLLVLVASGL